MKKAPLLYLSILAMLISFTSCKKQTIEKHENLIIEGNVAPPYDGISTTQIKVYVNKLHIDLLGIQASNTELDTYATYLKQQKLTEASRDSVIDVLLAKDEFYDKLYISMCARLLESISRYEIQQEANTYDYITQQYYLAGDTMNAQYANYIAGKLHTLSYADSLYKNNEITLNQFYGTFCDNSIYDEINMGSLNFVISCFENYLFRAPTTSEESSGVSMVDGTSAPLLHSDGNSKQDFIDIVTTSNEFYEGLVFENYTTYLGRQPDSYEMFAGTQLAKTGNNLKGLKKSILHTDEYAGFN